MNDKKLKSKRTPYYLYDIGLLEDTLKSMNEERLKHENYIVHYAIKANANPMILKAIKKYGLGIDCVSGGELKSSLEAGFTGSSIVFAGVAKNDEEIELGIDNDIFSFNVESIPELEVINELAGKKGKKANVCLRINPDVDAHTHANITTGLAENKFGLSKDKTEYWISIAKSMENIVFKGLHFHIGSQILDMEPFKNLCLEINDIQDRLEKNGISIEVINVGGGLGIDYIHPNEHPIPDFKAYFDTFAANLSLRDGQQLHFELGRALVGQCGSLITKTLYIKETSHKKFVMVDAGMTELIRPALYDAFHKIENISKSGNIRLYENPVTQDSNVTYDIVGPICESSDVFVKDYNMPATSRGDILAIRSAGAYGEVMASCYNCRPLPSSFSLEELTLD